MTLLDLEDLCLHCKSPETRKGIKQAVDFYNSQQYGACITKLWKTVKFDIKEKIKHVALYDAETENIINDNKGQDLLKKFENLDFIDSFQHKALNLLREIRNLEEHKKERIIFPEEARYYMRIAFEWLFKQETVKEALKLLTEEQLIEAMKKAIKEKKVDCVLKNFMIDCFKKKDIKQWETANKEIPKILSPLTEYWDKKDISKIFDIANAKDGPYYHVTGSTTFILLVEDLLKRKDVKSCVEEQCKKYERLRFLSPTALENS